MKNKALLIVIVVLLLVAGIGFFKFYKPVIHEADSDKSVTKRSFEVTVDAVGVLDAAKSHMISSKIGDANGKIIYLVDDGVQVKAGEVIIRLDPASYEKQVEQLKAEVSGLTSAAQAAQQVVEFEKNQVVLEIANGKYNQEVAELEHKRLRDGDGPLKISSLQEEVEKAKLELHRFNAYYKDLLALEQDGFENRSELQSAEENVAVYEAKFSAVNERYNNYTKHVLPALLKGAFAKNENSKMLVKQTEQGGKFKIAKAMASKAQVESKLMAKKSLLSQAEDELFNTTISAPYNGIVIHYETYREGQKRKPRIGDTVLPNQPILYLPDVSKMIVKSKVREVDLHKLKLGLKGRVKVEAYPEKSYQGELTFVGALATSEQSSQEKSFQIIFTVDDEDKRLRPGMSCHVSLLSKKVNEATAIPVQAIFYEGSTPYCFVRKIIGGYEKRPLTLGAKNNDFVEVLSGVEDGEKVSLTYRVAE